MGGYGGGEDDAAEVAEPGEQGGGLVVEGEGEKGGKGWKGGWREYVPLSLRGVGFGGEMGGCEGGGSIGDESGVVRYAGYNVSPPRMQVKAQAETYFWIKPITVSYSFCGNLPPSGTSHFTNPECIFRACRISICFANTLFLALVS